MTCRTWSQIDILRKLEHPNIVGVKEVVVDKENTYIIMELLSGGEVKRSATASKRPAQKIRVGCARRGGSSGSNWQQLASGQPRCVVEEAARTQSFLAFPLPID